MFNIERNFWIRKASFTLWNSAFKKNYGFFFFERVRAEENENDEENEDDQNKEEETQPLEQSQMIAEDEDEGEADDLNDSKDGTYIPEENE